MPKKLSKQQMLDMLVSLEIPEEKLGKEERAMEFDMDNLMSEVMERRRRRAEYPWEFE